MATIKAKLPDELIAKLTRLGNKTDEVCSKALVAGAAVVEKSVASNLSAVIGKSTKVESRSTGELKQSLGVTPVGIDKNGNYNIKIGFNEPRRKQTAAKGKRSYKTATNAMIANVLEYGRSGQPAKPFLKPAKRASRETVLAVMVDVLEEETKKI